MSIHPEFAQLILDGKKKVEFRKTRFMSQISHIVIYATAPVKEVVGYFEVKKIQIATPTELWHLYKKVAGIEQQFFENYYGNIKQGVAIEIGKVYQLDHSLSLGCISDSLVAPQSYMYLEKNLFNMIEENKSAF